MKEMIRGFFTDQESGYFFRILGPTAFFALCFSLSSCLPDPDADADASALQYDLSQPVFQKIYDFQDRAMADSLADYLTHSEPSIRLAALTGFASIRDSAYLSTVQPLLSDESVEVAAMAAYAVGQMGSRRGERPLIDAFRSMDTLGKYHLLNSRILEAVGKCGTEDALGLIASITTYLPSDTLLLEGQSRGLYRFALRGKTNEEGTAAMVNYSTRKQYPLPVRRIAAHYLARASNIDLTGYAYILSRTLESESDSYIRMALALAVGKTGSDRGRQILANAALNDSDYRVRANALRGLEIIGGAQLVPTAMEAIKDDHPGVSQIAAGMLIKYIDEDLASRIHEEFEHTELSVQSRSAVYAAALKNMPFYYTVSAGAINSQLQTLYANTDDPFEKRWWLEALSYDPVNLPFILDAREEIEDFYLKTNSLLVLGNTVRTAESKPAVNFNRGAVYRRVAEALTSAFQSGDVGAVATASDMLLRNRDLLDRHFRDIAFFEEILGEMNDPAQMQAKNQLIRVLGELFEVQRDFVYPEWSHPIDWELYDKLPDTVRVRMSFETGEVYLALPKAEAPGTTVNFVGLLLDDYYSDKTVHRVVTNFVIQGGCPRGDGYGSGDFTIRSELPPLYYDRTGLLGMASAGNHTESLQWFITHSPAMHLDGNYTIFGEVYSGIQTVHFMEPGTRILNIELLHE